MRPWETPSLGLSFSNYKMGLGYPIPSSSEILQLTSQDGRVEPEAPRAGLCLLVNSSRHHHHHRRYQVHCGLRLCLQVLPHLSITLPWTPGHMSSAELLHSQQKERAVTLQLSAPSPTQQRACGGGARFPVPIGPQLPASTSAHDDSHCHLTKRPLGAWHCALGTS